MLGTRFAVTAYERRHRSALLDLVAASHWTHLHLDWTTLGRWLDRGDGIFALAWHGDSLAGCMGLAETGPGAAWLRLLSLRDGFMAFPLVDAMWRALKLRCAKAGIHNIMALAICDWLPLCLAEQGFVTLDELVTMSLSADQEPAISPTWIRVKAAEIEDLERVAAVDAAAFPPIWRMPRLDLRDAWRGGADVKFADSKGRMVAYSLCLRELDLGHIARLAVLPNARGQGIGAALLHRALSDFLRRGIRKIGVNTQLSNRASARLYEYFGFGRSGPDFPIMNARLARGRAAP